MNNQAGPSHSLEGFPAAAVEFVNAMQRNRERIATEAGLTPSELRALFRVASVVSVTPKDLADYLDMTTGSVTFISSRLVERELLHRVAHPNDRRSLYLELTPKAHQMMVEIHREFVALLYASTQSLDAADRDVFTGMLRATARSISLGNSAPNAEVTNLGSGRGSSTHL